MDNFAQALQEFLHSICDVVGDEAIELDEIAVRATAKFGARMKANKRVGKKLTPSKYLKKYGNRWHSLKDEFIPEEWPGRPNKHSGGLDPDDQHEPGEKARMWDLKKKGREEEQALLKKLQAQGKVDSLGFAIKKTNEETDQAPKEQDPKARKLGAGEIAYAYIKRKEKLDASKIRRVGIDGSLQSAESFEPLEEFSKPVLKSYIEKAKEWMKRPERDYYPTTGDLIQKDHGKKTLSKKSIERLRTSLKDPAIHGDRKYFTKVARRALSIDDAKQKLNSEFVPEAKGMTPKKAKKEERLAKNRSFKNRFRDLEAKREMKMSKTGVPHSASGKHIPESVKPAKGTKKDKRPDVVHTELPIMPAGMNAGMRMMAASFDDFKGDLISELSKDTVYSAYKERFAQAKAHDDVGDTEGAKTHAKKALRTADYHKDYEASREKYAKYKEARATIAKRAKTTDPEAEKRLALQKRREARRTLYGDRKKNENAQ